jgi:hypothetical protein
VYKAEAAVTNEPEDKFISATGMVLPSEKELCSKKLFGMDANDEIEPIH